MRSTETPIWLDRISRPGSAAMATLAFAGVSVRGMAARAAVPKTNEAAQIREAQGPQALLSTTTKQMEAISQKVLASPDKHKLTPKELNETVDEPYTPFLLSAPGSKPNHYNLLYGAFTDDKDKLPLSIVVLVNADSTKLDHVKTYDEYLYLNPAVVDSKPLSSPELQSVGLIEQTTVNHWKEYIVGIKTNSPHQVDYPQAPGLVAKKYATFFKYADEIAGLNPSN